MGSYTAIIVGIGVGTLALLLGSAIMQGVYTAQWYGMLVNNLQYGTQKFAATYSIKKCIWIALFSMLLLFPFLALALFIIVPAFFTLMQYSQAVGDSPEQLAMLAGRAKVAPTTEMFPMSQINEALQHVRDGKARYRVVLKADF